MIGRQAHGWQLILADLALILFLVTLSALASEEARTGSARNAQSADPAIAPAQALFRPDPQGPSLAQWLAERPRDDRATLTIFAHHSDADREAIWNAARSLESEAQSAGFATRVVVLRSDRSDLHASLAYDLPR